MFFLNSKSKLNMNCFTINNSTIDRYSTEVDVDFVRKSVRAIGRCAIKVEVCVNLCLSGS